MRGLVSRRHLRAVLALLPLAAATPPAFGQQFNSDNYWTAPHGTQTSVGTVGENYSLLLVTGALFPRWEFNIGATLYKADPQANTPRYFSTTAYVKYMAYENEARNGGWGIMAGTGVNPGHVEAGALTNDLKSYWATVPVTIPFLDGGVSWDLMPGVSLNKEYGAVQDTTVGYTYSTRLAIYGVVPQSALVGEVFGSEGDAYVPAQYKVGVRWESKTIVAALTYGDTFGHEGRGGGLELGVLIFSPRFLCFGGC